MGRNIVIMFFNILFKELLFRFPPEVCRRRLRFRWAIADVETEEEAADLIEVRRAGAAAAPVRMVKG